MTTERQVRPLTWEEFRNFPKSSNVFLVEIDGLKACRFKEVSHTSIPASYLLWSKDIGLKNISLKELFGSRQIILFSVEFHWKEVMRWLIDNVEAGEQQN